ncbi:PaaI family thioesterase [Microvirga makkahensis]|uniref:PaaI family thioesterase n=1 Tax=Microvirga makkahensis TaxID=1128670 RepID=A0A7X3SMY1_9HYPH|nr:PaaI family thioesterase [Microvirga makkahensis]MXQ10715.1 PaaI family thioesterase [Microvirga makkahensis]
MTEPSPELIFAAATGFEPASEGWEIHPDTGFIGLIGPFWQRWDGERWILGLVTQPKHRNRRGVVQGGVLMTFADRALGMTAWHETGHQPQATIQLDVHFVEKVRIGRFVESRCQVVRRTRSLVFVGGTLIADSRVVATANGIWKILDRSKTSPG